MKDSQKEEYADKVIEFVKGLDSTLNEKETRRVISFAYKKYNKSLVVATPAKKTSTKKK